MGACRRNSGAAANRSGDRGHWEHWDGLATVRRRGPTDSTPTPSRRSATRARTRRARRRVSARPAATVKPFVGHSGVAQYTLPLLAGEVTMQGKHRTHSATKSSGRTAEHRMRSILFIGCRPADSCAASTVHCTARHCGPEPSITSAIGWRTVEWRGTLYSQLRPQRTTSKKYQGSYKNARMSSHSVREEAWSRAHTCDHSANAATPRIEPKP